MSYSALKTELALPEYNGLSDLDAASHYNSKTTTVQQPLVPLSDVQIWAASSDARRAIESHKVDTNQIGSICLTVLDFLKGGAGVSLDLSNGSNVAMIQALVDATVFSTAQQTSLLALSTVTVPYYTQPGQFGTIITDQDVHAARNI